MKYAFAILLLVAAALAATLHKRALGPSYEHELGESVAGALAAETRFRDVRVVMRQLDAVLFGEVDSPSDREAAQALAQSVWGVRARAGNNRIRVRARLDAIVEQDAGSQTALPLESVSIRGFLPESMKSDDLPAVFSGVSAHRKISSKEVGYYPFVGRLPKFNRDALAVLAAEFSRLPSIGTLELNEQGILLVGDTFPSQKKRLEELAAAALEPPARVESQLREIDLAQPARQALGQIPGLEGVQVQFNEAYATLTGNVASPDLRLRAAQVIAGLRLARLRDDQNRISLGGMFFATVARPPGGRVSVHLAGLLPDESWKAQLIASLGRLKPGWAVETGSLRFAPSLTPAGWLEKARFFAFFDEFFGSPAPDALRVDANGVVTQAKVTPALRERLRELAASFGFAPLQVRGEYELVPSVYHLPEYQRTSRIPAAQERPVETALAECRVEFAEASAELPPTEAARLDRLVAVLREAGPDVWLVVGGRAEVGANEATEQLCRARAEAVVQALEQRGLARDRCQIQTFAATRAAGGDATDEERRQSRRVEILLR